MIRAFNPQGLRPPPDPQYQKVETLHSRFRGLELEIGAGVGLHPILRAKEVPERLIVAVERTRDKYEKFLGRMESHQLPNLVGVHADVVPWIWHLPAQYKFEKIWLLYPNPEPGNKNQRWINAPVFSHILERLLPDGEIELATNIAAYADEVEKGAVAHWHLGVERSIYRGVGRTHFERKYLARGETCHNFILRKA